MTPRPSLPRFPLAPRLPIFASPRLRVPPSLLTTLTLALALTVALSVSTPLLRAADADSSSPVLVSTTGGGKAWATIPALKLAAEKGDAQAQAQLGEILLRGGDIPTDPPRALELLEEAARAGQGQAAFRLGMVFSNDDFVPTNLERSFAYLRAAAAGGVAEAFRDVGVAYSKGQGVKRDYTEALAWFVLAKKHDTADGVDDQLRNYLTKLHRPELITAGEKRAPEIEKELAATTVDKLLPPPAPFTYIGTGPSTGGEPGARKSTLSKDGTITLPPLPVSTSDRPAAPPVKLILPTGQRAVWNNVIALQSDARAGKPEALAALGQVLLDGNLLSTDTARATTTLEEGAKAGSADAAQILAELYTKGDRLDRDDAKAFTYTLQAAKGGVFTAMYNLGALYTNGRGTAINYPEALTWFLVAQHYNHDGGGVKRIREYLEKTAPAQIPAAEKKSAALIKDIDKARDNLPGL